MALNRQWTKEWIPLVTQQLRLRNLTQVLAYNVRGPASPSGSSRALYYFTLHLTSKSAPFYSSEHCAGPNPRWAEIDLQSRGTSLSGTGLVVRIWQCGNPDQLVTVWGLHLSGLVPVPPQTDLSKELGTNTLVFYVQGFPFVSPSNSRPAVRLAKAEVTSNSTRSSYSVPQLLRLHHVQLDTAHHAAVSESLKQSIERLGPFPPPTAPSGLLGSPSRQYQIQQLQAAREEARHRLWLLRGERARRAAAVASCQVQAEHLEEDIQDTSANLTSLNKTSRRDSDQLIKSQLLASQTRESLAHTMAQLANRRRQLINQLKFIYPITEDGQGGMKICGVPLSSSENLGLQDESSSAVALGFAAHATVMVATFLDVPLRYSIIPAGSRARVRDLVAPKLPDSEREFPLFSRGREKIQYNYAVYLLNKDIAQLRWYCGLVTRDLRLTLLNLRDLLQMRVAPSASHHKRSLSSSSQELINLRLLPPTSHTESSEESQPSRRGTSTSPNPTTMSDNTRETHLKKNESSSTANSLKPQKSPGSLENWDLCFLDPPVSKETPSVKEPVLSGSLDQGLDTLRQPPNNYVLSMISSKALNSSEPSLNCSKQHRDIDPKSTIEIVESETILLMPPCEPKSATAVKSRTFPEPSLSDNRTVTEEFHDCLSVPSCETLQSETNISPSESDVHQSKSCKLDQDDSKIVTEEASKSDNSIKKINSVDNIFANVASRTEALASRSGSFNLVKSRASTMENS